jgi:hypothetical protein
MMGGIKMTIVLVSKVEKILLISSNQQTVILDVFSNFIPKRILWKGGSDILGRGVWTSKLGLHKSSLYGSC